jgi:HMG (high mobility group) box
MNKILNMSRSSFDTLDSSSETIADEKLFDALYMIYISSTETSSAVNTVDVDFEQNLLDSNIYNDFITYSQRRFSLGSITNSHSLPTSHESEITLSGQNESIYLETQYCPTLIQLEREMESSNSSSVVHKDNIVNPHQFDEISWNYDQVKHNMWNANMAHEDALHSENPETCESPDMKAKLESSIKKDPLSSIFKRMDENIKFSKAENSFVCTDDDRLSLKTETNQVVQNESENRSKAPLRPLSAYNYFFRVERERILFGTEPDDDYSYTVDQQDRILREHWNHDRTAKRRHRKTHGKISFTELSKLVGKRWKTLPLSQKDFYKQTALRDLERFRCEMKSVKEIGSCSEV